MSMKEYVELRALFQERKLRMSKECLNALIKDCEQGLEDALFRDEGDDYRELIDDIECEILNRDDAEVKDIELRCEEEKLRMMKDEKSISEIGYSFFSSSKLALTIMDYECGNLFEEVERELIGQCLYHFNGNRTKTAKAMGISIRTIRNKLNKYKKDGIAHDMLLDFYERECES